MSLEDDINIAPEQNLGEQDLNSDDNPDINPDDSQGGDDLANNDDPPPEQNLELEKEPTVKELMELVKTQGTQIEKANNRTQYLQRKFDRSSKVQTFEPEKEKPDADNYETNAEYIEAITDWKVDQRERSNAETQIKNHSKEQEADFFAVIDSGTEKYADFNEVARKLPADGGPEITSPMLEAMMECDNPIDVAYYLGENVEESKRIARLSPIAAGREIGKIEARFEAGGVKKTPQKTTTKTIAPSSPIAGKTVTTKGLENLSTKDFMTSRNKQFGAE